ncbi:hypothetical protein HYW21_02750 [Candidatus Woesearchaeota archaeon]|nr:hypothetical protein [Candidatus Woesearchaeota archaeon]
MRVETLNQGNISHSRGVMLVAYGPTPGLSSSTPEAWNFFEMINRYNHVVDSLPSFGFYPQTPSAIPYDQNGIERVLVMFAKENMSERGVPYQGGYIIEEKPYAAESRRYALVPPPDMDTVSSKHSYFVEFKDLGASLGKGISELPVACVRYGHVVGAVHFLCAPRAALPTLTEGEVRETLAEVIQLTGTRKIEVPPQSLNDFFTMERPYFINTRPREMMADMPVRFMRG